MIEVKIKPVGTKVCPVCGISDFDMPSFKPASFLNEHAIMKKQTTQMISVINQKATRNTSRMTSLF